MRFQPLTSRQMLPNQAILVSFFVIDRTYHMSDICTGQVKWFNETKGSVSIEQILGPDVLFTSPSIPERRYSSRPWLKVQKSSSL